MSKPPKAVFPGDDDYPIGAERYASGYVVEWSHGKYMGVGPAAEGRADCGHEGIACRCQGCGRAFCRRCWWEHSHTRG